MELYEVIYLSDDPEKNAAGESDNGSCMPYLDVRPLKDFPEGYGNYFRYAMTLSIALSFGLMGLVFWTFDRQTKIQDQKMVQYAAQSNQVISSLFPSQVRDRMFNITTEEKVKDEDTGGFSAPMDGNSTVGGSSAADVENVIADLYPNTSILFADIAGKWSSDAQKKTKSRR